ncbi:DUF1150 family protein [Pseudogemmobacter blasticus]|uniref:DUF1150 domain-containing protein n=1 Tax=Fuscovulum blasticum DSM 2131 TaxID=1188250 RepID=A0A2T4J730_FUSBL|nr:DUF1150 family protein [Fuscovulum blasticum]AWD21705.1 hypothetical protein B6K69_08460 [Fuscovulum blasticum]PTE13712.1 DUF1150 domain-containing protein [Fuscovulum blasticum DSM 2131]
MNTPFPGFPADNGRIAYVRPILVADLPEDLQAQADGAEVIYAVHSSDGKRLALVADRTLAFHLARAHDFAPVSVH